LLKDRNVYEVVDFSKKRKAINNCWIFNIKSNGCYKSQLVAKKFLKLKKLTLINYSSQLSAIRQYTYF